MGKVKELSRQLYKTFLKKNDDSYIALMIYHSTPLHNGFSPPELLKTEDFAQLYLR